MPLLLELLGWVELPIIELFIPLGHVLDFVHFLWWDEILYYGALQFQLVVKLEDGVVHVLFLTHEVFLPFLYLTLHILILLPHFGQLACDVVQLLLKRSKLFRQIYQCILFLSLLELQFLLLTLLTMKDFLRFLQLFGLLFGFLDHFVTNQDFLFHLLELLDHVVLLFLRLLLGLFLFSEFGQQFLLLFLS